MDTKNLTITVSGESGSGKSTVVYLLKNLLRSMEFNVNQEVNSDFDSETQFDEHMENNIDEKLGNLIDTRNIVINEVQTNRNPK